MMRMTRRPGATRAAHRGRLPGRWGALSSSSSPSSSSKQLRRPAFHLEERVSRARRGARELPVTVVAATSADAGDGDAGWGTFDEGDGGGGGGELPEPDESNVRRNVFVDIARVRFLFYNYFNTPGKWFRKYLWWCVSLLFGFYFSNTLSLTFGALGVNDVIAGIVCLVAHEIITTEYYCNNPRSLVLFFVNAIKMGFVWGCVSDCVKLNSWPAAGPVP